MFPNRLPQDDGLPRHTDIPPQPGKRQKLAHATARTTSNQPSGNMSSFQHSRALPPLYSIGGEPMQRGNGNTYATWDENGRREYQTSDHYARSAYYPNEIHASSQVETSAQSPYQLPPSSQQAYHPAAYVQHQNNLNTSAQGAQHQQTAAQQPTQRSPWDSEAARRQRPFNQQPTQSIQWPWNPQEAQRQRPGPPRIPNTSLPLPVGTGPPSPITVHTVKDDGLYHPRLRKPEEAWMQILADFEEMSKGRFSQMLNGIICKIELPEEAVEEKTKEPLGNMPALRGEAYEEPYACQLGYAAAALQFRNHARRRANGEIDNMAVSSVLNERGYGCCSINESLKCG